PIALAARRGWHPSQSCPRTWQRAGATRTPTRTNGDAASLSNSSLLPTIPASPDIKNPVTLPPGRAKLSTNPSATGLSATPIHTTGVVRVTLLADTAAGVEPTTITGGLEAISSAMSAG